MSSCTLSHSPLWLPRRPERHDRGVLEHQPGQLPRGVEGGDDLDRDTGGGGGRVEQVRAHALLAARHDDGPVRSVAVDDRRLVAAHHPARALASRPGPHRAEWLAVTLLSEGDGPAPRAGREVSEQLGGAEGAGGQGGRYRRREERAGQWDTTHLLRDDAHLEQSRAVAGTAELVGNEQPGPSELDQCGPQLRRDPGVVVGEAAEQLGVTGTLDRGARHLLECQLPLVVREVHGLPRVRLSARAGARPRDDRSLTPVSQYTAVRYSSPVDFALAPEDEKFRDELRAWLDEHLPPFLEAEALGDDAQLSGEASQKRRQRWQKKLHEGGWAAIHWGPEYANGRTVNAMQRLLYSEVMAEYRTPGMFNTNGIWQIGPMIIQWGTEEQKAQWLPSILEAEEHWCQGFSEPMAGNDLANLRTTAIYDPETDEYVVNGSKIWISSAHLATWGLFLLRTDPSALERGKKHEGITAFVLNLKTPGIEVRPIKDMAGEELFNEIFFTDVRVPASWRLGEEGAGWMVAMGTLGFERVGIASQIAILAADLRAVVEAARSVNPDALEDPSLRDRVARLWTEVELARLLSLRALSKIMKGEKNWPEVPFAKLSWSSMAQTLAELAVDLLGPAGLLARGGADSVDRGKWTRLYAFQRYSTIGGGSTEIQKNIIADRAIAMPGKSRA